MVAQIAEWATRDKQVPGSILSWIQEDFFYVDLP